MRKAKNKALFVKGMYTPRILIWFRGVVHGKILHSAGLNMETHVLASGYITGQIKRFRNACVTCCATAEKRINPAWVEADHLLIELASVSSSLSDDLLHKLNHKGETSEQIRYMEKMENRRALYEEKREKILKELADINNIIKDAYEEAYLQMQATAEILLSTFSCYGHGVMLRPVFDTYLPTIEYEDCAKQLLRNHQDSLDKIESILKEVKE